MTPIGRRVAGCGSTATPTPLPTTGDGTPSAIATRAPSSSPPVGSSSTPSRSSPPIKTVADLIADPLDKVTASEVTTVSQDGNVAEAHCKAALKRETAAQRALDRETGCLVWIAAGWVKYVESAHSGTPAFQDDAATADWPAVRQAYEVSVALLGPAARPRIDAIFIAQLASLTAAPNQSPPTGLRTAAQFMAEKRAPANPGSIVRLVHDAVTDDLLGAAASLDGDYQWLNVSNGDSDIASCVRGESCDTLVTLWSIYRADGVPAYYAAALEGFRISYKAAQKLCGANSQDAEHGCPLEILGSFRDYLSRH